MVHIKPTAPHHTTVLTTSVKKNSTIRSFTYVISVKIIEKPGQNGTLAECGRFTLLRFIFLEILPLPLKIAINSTQNLFKFSHNLPDISQKSSTFDVKGEL